jgi:hypothetical protein
MDAGVAEAGHVPLDDGEHAALGEDGGDVEAGAKGFLEQVEGFGEDEAGGGPGAAGGGAADFLEEGVVRAGDLWRFSHGVQRLEDR